MPTSTPLEMHFIPDQPIENEGDDAFGFAEFVDLLHRSVAHTTPPFVYGVLGDWGAGKTSVLRLLENRFNFDLGAKDKPLVPIPFDAWEYENEANLIYPLLHAIKRDYMARLGGRGTERAFLDKFREVVSASVLLTLDTGVKAATKSLTGEAFGFKEIGEQLKTVREQTDGLSQVLEEWTDSVERLKTAFAELLRIYARDLAALYGFQQEEVRFVILVDDLDRCLPETVIKVLESIKNYLTLRGAPCVFMLALNARVVYQGIAVKYGGASVDGRQYLEKFLNYSFYVPEPKAKSVIQFTEDRIALLLPQKDQRTHYAAYIRAVGQALDESRFNNPRKIKRILNRFLFFIAKYEAIESDAKLRQFNLVDYPTGNVVRLTAMAEYFPDLFQLFLYNIKKADVARQKMTFAGPNFNADEFENEFAVKILSRLPELIAMAELFKLVEQRDGAKPNLSEQAQAVYTLTRLV